VVVVTIATTTDVIKHPLPEVATVVEIRQRY
jgi:hypothetical protein